MAETDIEIINESSAKPALKRVSEINGPVPTKGMPVIEVLGSMLQEKLLPTTLDKALTEKVSPLHILWLGGESDSKGIGCIVIVSEEESATQTPGGSLVTKEKTILPVNPGLGEKLVFN